MPQFFSGFALPTFFNPLFSLHGKLGHFRLQPFILEHSLPTFALGFEGHQQYQKSKAESHDLFLGNRVRSSIKTGFSEQCQDMGNTCAGT